MSDLKPCPFCGSKSVGYFDESLSIVNGFYLKGIKCDKCGGAIIVSDPYKCADDVYDMWNKRSSTNIILCADCRFFDSYPIEHTEGKCTRLGRMCCEDDFCSDAEEKEDG